MLLYFYIFIYLCFYTKTNSKTFELCLSVRPSVCGKHDCVRTQRATDLKIYMLLLPLRWLVLKMGYIGPQDLVPPI